MTIQIEVSGNQYVLEEINSKDIEVYRNNEYIGKGRFILDRGFEFSTSVDLAEEEELEFYEEIWDAYSKQKQTIKLYQYQGGGYDGCIWEWNWFLIDGNGEFVDIYSSGYRAVKSLIAAEKIIQSEKEDLYVYDLSKEEDLEEFTEENHPTNLGLVCNAVNTTLEQQIMFYKCTYCGEKVYPIDNDQYPSYFFDEENYSGNGGIGILYHAVLCEECYYNRCDECNSIIQPDDIAEDNGQGQYLCQYCRDEQE